MTNKLFKTNKGRGSRRAPLVFSVAEGQDQFRRELVKVAAEFGEVWVETVSHATRGELAECFNEGLIVPIPRVAKQNRDLMRYQVTGIARELYGEKS